METKITALPSMEHTFTLENLKGAETGKPYNGTFTYKRLTLGQRLEVAKMESRLREAIPKESIPMDVNLYVEMVAYLRYGLVKVEPWYKDSNYGIDLYDINVITTLYKICDDFEASWEKQVKGE